MLGRTTIIVMTGAALAATVSALLLAHFVVEFYRIASLSMAPSLLCGDRVMASRWTRKIDRGDVVVITHPSGDSASPRIVKRVMGLPGERVEVKQGIVLIDGVPLAHDAYERIGHKQERRNVPAVQLAKNRYYVMGDNRTESVDSSNVLGTVPASHVLAQAYAVYWPPHRIRLLTGARSRSSARKYDERACVDA